MADWIAVAAFAVVVAGSAIIALRRFADRYVLPPTAVAAIPPAGQAPTAGQCTIAGCPRQETWPCSYRERTGARCNLRRCPDHVEMVDGRPYCHRHAGVVRALSHTEGSILQVKGQPSLHDRAVPLLNLVCEALNPGLTALLEEAAGTHPDIQVARQKMVQEVWNGSDRVAWQANWGLHTQRGYLLRVSIRVGVAEPPEVEAIVDARSVFMGVPTWIGRRLRGEPPDPADHGAFTATLLEAIGEAVEERMVDVREQLDYELEKFHAVPPRPRF